MFSPELFYMTYDLLRQMSGEGTELMYVRPAEHVEAMNTIYVLANTVRNMAGALSTVANSDGKASVDIAQAALDSIPEDVKAWIDWEDEQDD
ncbi:hypothetical protein [Alicyclobacillus shizuokensis]|uniref:hypothetical protein n=1 Tax=Alicyclobacillus shizuokensis TaxID=392014 RepID=UPI00082D4AC9|nr:hypothetical protein [Alicyclobacillus shizuokensis]